jgi:hypothetical protein
MSYDQPGFRFDTAMSVNPRSEPGPRRACQRIDHPFSAKDEAIKWLLAATLATSTLLSCHASYAAQKTIEWSDDLQWASIHTVLAIR